MPTMTNTGNVLHWYDFLCPFCYVGQSRTEILARHGLNVIELPFQAHPDIPVGGAAAGPRIGPMYTVIEREAIEAGLELNWPDRLPNTRRALAAAEWVRLHQPEKFASFRKRLFAAHFTLGEDLGSDLVIFRHAGDLGIDLLALQPALASGSAIRLVDEAEELGRRYRVNGTPAWLVAGELVSGLLPAQEFERLAEVTAHR
jgi:predicted DsbA family dithiol-disulfide isomerase